jgi:adenosylhomocysteine nucleosidase
MSPAQTLVLFALPEEARPFQRRARELSSVRVLVTGMGRRNTERALAAEWVKGRAELVLTCGFAGALDPALALNTVLFETAGAALAARLSGAGLRPAKFHCADRMAVTASEKAALRRESRADAVEMESAVVHQFCREHGVPCATVRVISDTAAEDMPLDFNALTTPEMKLDFVKLAQAILKSPGKIGGLLRLQRQTASAAKMLADKLLQILPG